MRSSLLAIGLMLFGASAYAAEDELTALLELAEPGDIILIGDAGIWTDMAQSFSTGDQRYGHVGILTGHRDAWTVTDAGGPILGGGAGVAERPLEAFLDRAKRIGLYRSNLTLNQRQKLLRSAAKMAEAGLPFDQEWDLGTADAVYCTEFVWRALKSVTNEDPAPSRTKAASKSLLSLSDLQASPYLEEIGEAHRP